MNDVTSAHGPDLHARLRAATADAHTRLETGLALLDPPLSESRFRAVLQRFWGFHSVWEPVAVQALELLMQGRSKLALLERDLAALGMAPEAVAGLPRCAAAAQLGGGAARMLGSAYVLEGSTLGGQVISRALSGAAWLPEGGLHYFYPYGGQTGVMWREFRAALEAASGPAADAAIISGAVETFTLLRQWLCQETPVQAAG